MPRSARARLTPEERKAHQGFGEQWLARAEWLHTLLPDLEPAEATLKRMRDSADSRDLATFVYEHRRRGGTAERHDTPIVITEKYRPRQELAAVVHDLGGVPHTGASYISDPHNPESWPPAAQFWDELERRVREYVR
jgi:hypothetical protein